jgi:predicted O-methyltransferase YrrM
MASFGRFRLVKEYLLYRLRAGDRHGLHSPFVYKLLDEVIYGKTSGTLPDKIEHIRRTMLASTRIIELEDFGATPGLHIRKLRDIVKSASKPRKYSQLLYRLSAHFKPKTILELGTSAGISSMYMAAGQAGSDGKTITIEGSAAMAAVAKENFQKAGLTNIESYNGTFEDVLPGLLQREVPDFVFFDGNHRMAPTLFYFEQCLEKAGNDAVFVFDDINWSDEMQKAWKIIKQHPEVTVTVDLFFIGLVFIRKEQEKEDFVLRF